MSFIHRSPPKRNHNWTVMDSRAIYQIVSARLVVTNGVIVTDSKLQAIKTRLDITCRIHRMVSTRSKSIPLDTGAVHKWLAAHTTPFESLDSKLKSKLSNLKLLEFQK